MMEKTFLLYTKIPSCRKPSQGCKNAFVFKMKTIQ